MTCHPTTLQGTIPRYVPVAGDERSALKCDYLGFLTNVASQCGAIGMYHRGTSPVVLINSPELVRAMLVDGADDLTKGDLQRTAFQALLGKSLSMSEGARHDRLRRLLAPLFTRRQIGHYANRIVRTADIFCAGWADQNEIDLFTELHRLTQHTVGGTLIDESALWDEIGIFWQAGECLWRWINDLAGQRRGLADRATDILNPQVANAITTVQQTVDHVIRTRRESASTQGDLLADVLHENNRTADPLNPTEVRDQIIALVFAAHETSAAALFWSLYLLAGHPVVLRRVEHEIDDILGGRLPGVRDLPALPQVLLVIKESMRLYPPAPRQFRVATRDTSLAGHPIAAGTPVSVCQYVLHRSPAVFPQPDRFVPERFTPHAPIRHPLSYLPFGAGERTCLGRHYAMQEVHLLLALLIGRFRFTFTAGVRPQLAVTLRPGTAVHVQVRRRSRSGQQ